MPNNWFAAGYPAVYLFGNETAFPFSKATDISWNRYTRSLESLVMSVARCPSSLTNAIA